MTQNQDPTEHKLSGIEQKTLPFPFDVKIVASLIHSVSHGMYAKDRQGTFIFANFSYCRYIGKALNEILGKTDFDIYPQNLAEQYYADDQLIMLSGKTRVIEESRPSIDGEPNYVQVVKTPLVDSEDPKEVLGTLGVLWDITERKKAQVRREEEHKFLRALLDSIPTQIYVKDTQGRFLIANKATADFLGAASPEELIGKSDFDYYTKEVAQAFADVEQEILKTGKSIKDVIDSFIFKGKKFWINSSKKLSRNPAGEIVGLVGVGHDITHLKQIEEKLRESEQRYAAVINQALEGIYLMDPNTKKVLDTNESFQKLIGYSKEELRELRVYDFVVHDHSEINGIIKHVINLEDYTIGERCYRHKDGYFINVEVSATLINYGGKQAILVIIRDISGKKAAQEESERLKEQLRQAQKFEALGTLAGGVAHDLNNILSGIVSYPELLMNKLPKDSELIKPLSVIHDSGVRASTVVADLLTLARSAASNKQVCDLNTLVREFVESPEYDEVLSRHQGLSYHHQFSNGPANILCSPVHIKKCLVNLVSNASEALGSYGKVSIKVSDNHIDPPHSLESVGSDDHYVLLQVSDTGSGISPKDLGHIFEPFYTKKKMGRSGTGLGLTVVWNTVNDHGGIVTVDSDTNGTCFNIYFPQSASETKDESMMRQDLQMSEKNEHILIVDDEPVLRDIASEMLTQLGYRVDTVSSGELAIEFVRKAPVDLLLIDMIMEPGINWRETYQEIRKMYPDINALIVSGYSEDEDVQEALRSGAKGFVQKPYLMNRLAQAVKDALYEKSKYLPL